MFAIFVLATGSLLTAAKSFILELDTEPSLYMESSNFRKLLVAGVTVADDWLE